MLIRITIEGPQLKFADVDQILVVFRN